MFEWFRRRPAGRAPRLRGRDDLDDALRVEFAELAPDLRVFLGHTAYIALGLYEALTELVGATDDLTAKDAAARAAGAALTRHQELSRLLADEGEDPAAAMLPFRAPLDAFRRGARGGDFSSSALAIHLVAGMTQDFGLALAPGYGDAGRRVTRILRTDDALGPVVGLVAAEIARDDDARSYLALWGRRILGDALLATRLALRPSPRAEDADERIEPVFTALVAGHVRRMADLGLDA